MLSLLLTLPWLGSGDVDMTLAPSAQTVPLNCFAYVDLVLSSDAPSSVSAYDVVLSWDPAELDLIQGTPGPQSWFVAGFLNDPDGINDDVTDGDAIYTGLASPASPLTLPPDAVVATFEFQVLGDGDVDLLATLGTSGESQVVGVLPGQIVTGDLTGPASVTAGPAASAEVSRVGVPANPDVYLPGVTSGPVIGSVWDPVIDHTTFFPGAVLDALFVSIDPVNIPVPPYGTILCELPWIGDPQLTSPGVPFTIPIANNCAFVGLEFCSQGISVDAFNDARLTNALDLTLGTF